MKDVRNAKLRNILNKEGIKDVVINFSEGFAMIYSDDEFTHDVLSRSMKNSIETRSFRDYSVQEWADMIREMYNEGLANIEESKKWQSGERKLKMDNGYKTNIGDSAKIKDGRWKLTLNEGKYLREAIRNEDHDQIFVWLENLYTLINEKMPEYFSDDDLQSELAEIEDVADSVDNMYEYELDEDEVEELIDGLLSKFYDLCDELRIFVGL